MDYLYEDPDSFDLMTPKKTASTQGTAANTQVQTPSALVNPALEKTNPGGNASNIDTTVSNLMSQIQDPASSLKNVNDPNFQEALKQYQSNTSSLNKPLFDSARSSVENLYAKNTVDPLNLSNTMDANKQFLDQSNARITNMNKDKNALAQRFNYFFDQYTGLSSNLGNEDSLFSMFKNKGLQKQALSSAMKTQDQQVDIFKKELDSALQSQLDFQKQNVGLNEKKEVYDVTSKNEMNKQKLKDLVDISQSEASVAIKGTNDAVNTAMNRNPESIAKALESVNLIGARADLVKAQEEKIKAENEKNANFQTEQKFVNSLPVPERINRTRGTKLKTVKEPSEGKPGVYMDIFGNPYDPGNDATFISKKIEEAFAKDKAAGKTSKALTQEKDKLKEQLDVMKLNNDDNSIRDIALAKFLVSQGDISSAVSLLKSGN